MDILEYTKKMLDESVEEINNWKSDITITCKITFSDIPAYAAHSSDCKKQLEVLINELKSTMSETPNTKTKVTMKIKDKYIEKPKTAKDELEEAIDNLGEFCKLLEDECYSYLNERAKEENKTPDQVLEDIFKKYEGKTWGEVLKEIKDEL